MKVVDSSSSKILTDALGAFFGAFFAFLFGLATYYWTKWVERQKKDYDAMVRLEGVLNEHLNVFERNEFLIHGSINSLSHGTMTYNILRKYRLVEDVELSFLDINLINQYFSYRDSVNSLNNDFEVTNRANDVLREMVLNTKVNDAAIKANAQNLIESLTALNKMTSVTDDETKNLLCIVRIKLRIDRPGILGIKRLIWEPHKVTNEEIKKEMVQLESEIAESKETNAKTILQSLKK